MHPTLAWTQSRPATNFAGMDVPNLRDADPLDIFAPLGQHPCQESGVTLGNMSWKDTSQRCSRSRFVPRMRERSRWHWQGVLLWLAKHPQVRGVPLPWPSTDSVIAWRRQSRFLAQRPQPSSAANLELAIGLRIKMGMRQSRYPRKRQGHPRHGDCGPTSCRIGQHPSGSCQREGKHTSLLVASWWRSLRASAHSDRATWCAAENEARAASIGSFAGSCHEWHDPRAEISSAGVLHSDIRRNRTCESPASCRRVSGGIQGWLERRRVLADRRPAVGNWSELLTSGTVSADVTWRLPHLQAAQRSGGLACRPTGGTGGAAQLQNQELQQTQAAMERSAMIEQARLNEREERIRALELHYEKARAVLEHSRNNNWWLSPQIRISALARSRRCSSGWWNQRDLYLQFQSARLLLTSFRCSNRNRRSRNSWAAQWWVCGVPRPT